MTIGKEFLERLQNVKVAQRKSDKAVKSLIKDFQDTKIKIPEYQRNFVWPSDIQCRFIESIFMNVPIPSIFLLEKTASDGRTKIYEVLDGVQRLSTLTFFCKDELRLKGLEKLNDLNQVTFSMLPEEIKTFFLEQKIPIVSIEETTTPDIRFEIFERLNQGSVSLNAQELRNCMFHGPFNDFLKRLSDKTAYKELLSSFGQFKPTDPAKPDKNRMLNVEMVLRFFALYEGQKQSKNESYSHPRKEFLNSYMEQKDKYREHSELFESETKDLEDLFEKVISMVKMTFGKESFKRFAIDKGHATFFSLFNKAVFDAQMLGFVDCNHSEIQSNIDIIRDAFLDLSIHDQKFIATVKSSTDHQIDVRVKMWKNRLRHVLENSSKYKENFESKRKSFNKNPNCSVCNSVIDTFDEAYLDKDQLIHRVCKADKTDNKPRTKTIKFLGKEGESYEFDNVDDALDFLLPLLKREIGENPIEVERLSSLDFIGTALKFKSTKLKSLKISNKDDEPLFMDRSGTVDEIVSKMQEIASLYGFFEVVVE